MKKGFTLLILMSFVLLFSCEESTKYDRELAVYGKVIDENGNPVANAEVVVFPDMPASASGSIKTSQKIMEVELADFNVEDMGDFVLVTWSTNSEMNNKTFVVERAMDNSPDFEEIYSTDGAGKSIEKKEYEYLDYDISVDQFYSYRLKIINESDEYDYSDVRSVQTFNPVVQIASYPNPFDQNVSINFTMVQSDNTKIEIVEDATGDVVFSYNQLTAPGNYTIVYNGRKDDQNIRPGVYTFNLHYGDSVKSQKMIKYLPYEEYLTDFPMAITKTDENGDFKLTYNYFPDADQHKRILVDGSVMGAFVFGSAKIITRKVIDDNDNQTVMLVSKNEITIDKTKIEEITCNAQEVTKTK